MDGEYTEMTIEADDSIQGQKDVFIKIEPTYDGYENPTYNSSQDGVVMTSTIKKEREELADVQKNNKVPDEHASMPFKPPSHASSKSNTFNVGGPNDACTSDDIPNSMADLVGVEVKPSSEDRLASHVVGFVGSNLTLLDPSGQSVNVDVNLFWCNFCSHRSDKKEEMLHHLMSHRFRCPNCSFQTYSRAAVMQHDLDAHGNSPKNSLKFFALLPDILESKKSGKRKQPDAGFEEPANKRECKSSEKEIEPLISDSSLANINNENDIELKISGILSGPEAVNSLVKLESSFPSQPSSDFLGSTSSQGPDSELSSLNTTQLVSPSVSSKNIKPGPSSSALCWNCGYCEFVTLNQSFLKVHLNNNHSKMTHKYVALLASTEEEMNKIKASDAQYSTNRYYQTFANQPVLNKNSNIENGQNNQATTEPSDQTDDKSNDATSDKMKDVNGNNNQKKDEKLKSLPQTFKCAHCNFSSLKPEAVKTHLIKNHCGLVLYGLDMRAVRLKEKRYVFFCLKDDCSFYTKDTNEFLKHINGCFDEDIDKSTRIGKSLLSTKTFIEKTDKRGSQTTQVERLSDYSCEYCPYKGNNTWIKKHVLSHHQNKENLIIRTNKGQGPRLKVYFCFECLWETNSADDLKSHMSKHDLSTSSNEKSKVGEPKKYTTLPPPNTTKSTSKDEQVKSRPHIKKVVTPTKIIKKKEIIEDTNDGSGETDNSSVIDYTKYVSEEQYESALSRFVKRGTPSMRGTRPSRNAALKCKAALKQDQLPPLYQCVYCSVVEFGSHLMQGHVKRTHSEKPLHAVNVINKENDPSIKNAFFCPQEMCDFVAHVPMMILKHAKSVHSLRNTNKHLSLLLAFIVKVNESNLNDAAGMDASSSSTVLDNTDCYQCFYCPGTPSFNSIVSMYKHFLDEHKTEDCRYHNCDLSIMGKLSKYYMCQVPTCPYSTHEREEYLLHMLAHQKMMIFKCSQCPWFSKIRNEMDQHMKSLHNENAGTVLNMSLDLDDTGNLLKCVGPTVKIEKA